MKRAKAEWAWREDALRLQRLGFPPFTKRPRVLFETTVTLNGCQVPVQLVRYSSRGDAALKENTYRLGKVLLMRDL